jgi:two-component system, chemotaxis family, sensor kinase CheA
MKIGQYKEQFVSEAKEHIDLINDSLLIFEKEPENDEIINKLFRSFHTLKGNSATMGYTNFSELAHHLEDLLDKARAKQLIFNSDLIDILFKGIDILEKGLDFILEDKSEDLQINDFISNVDEILLSLSSSPNQINEINKPKKEITFSDSEIEAINQIKENGNNVFHITILLDKDNSLKGAKSLIIYREINSSSNIIKSFPQKEKLLSTELDDKFQLIISSEKKKDFFISLLDSFSGINSYDIFEFEINKFVSDNKNDNPNNLLKENDKAKIAKMQKEAMNKQIQSVKIDIKSLDILMNLVGELLISKIRLEQISKSYNDKVLNNVVGNLTRLTIDIQDQVMKQRMIPIGNIFNRFPRMVRDLAKKEGKEIELIIEGQDIEFDRTILDEIGDPLVHLIRNCVDHGIETPYDREKFSKNKTGIIKLVARKEQSNAIIEIIDDGQGINPKKVKESCIKKGVITKEEADLMDDKSLIRLIFKPGVSTNTVVTEVSGRGVGMDVVETKIRSLGGYVKIDSIIGKGTVVKIQLPLTLAIVNSLLVQVDNFRYAIPLSGINRTVKLNHNSIKSIHGNDVFLLMNQDIPIIWLSKVLHNKKPDVKDNYTIVVVDKDDSKIGLVVDLILFQQQVLIKSLDDTIKGIKGLGGATILGDGKVAMILDVATLFD